jgi:hypothetical protein
MKTTNKAIKDQIQKHIIEGLSEDTYQSTKMQLQQVKEEFYNWYSPYEQKRTPNKQEAFKEFMNGLPSCLNMEYTYHGIHTTMRSWFENAGETYKEPKDDSKEADLYGSLIYREFNTLCKKNGVQF